MLNSKEKSVFARATVLHAANSADGGEFPRRLAKLLPMPEARQAMKEIRKWPGYAPTPLRSLDSAAAQMKVAGVYYKDESRRFATGSFKALGGAYAVFRHLSEIVRDATGHVPDGFELAEGKHAKHTRNVTVAAATDGNHGRAVAWGAQMFGCKCRIYLHAGVSDNRQTAIESFGAKIKRVRGDYDESLRQCSADAAKHGWAVISDTECSGCGPSPLRVMAGYCLMIEEALAQAPVPITHIFAQGGVGGLAAAVCAWSWRRLGADRPRISVVEPELAACLHASAVNQKPTIVQIAEETIMAGLSCGEVSAPAWKILHAGASDFIVIQDKVIAPLMRALSRLKPTVESGESGAAGLAGALHCATDSALRSKVKINAKSQILTLGTEGATDPQIYRQILAA